MKLNETTFVLNENIALVPYNEEHVAKYHSWMEQKELREATGSELLSLSEEYAMQRNWREDEDKCTFIIMKRVPSMFDCPDHMLGDVNLFLRNDLGSKIGEVSIMIGDECNRGQGIGFDALCLMLYYGVRCLDVRRLEAKIGIGNTASVKLFEKAGFRMVEKSEVFQEATYTLFADGEWMDWLQKTAGNIEILFNAS